MDEGWTRWLLEDFGFAYTSVRNARPAGRESAPAFDAIVFPDQPRAQSRTAIAPGRCLPEYTGGLGEKGAAALKEFVEQAARWSS